MRKPFDLENNGIIYNNYKARYNMIIVQVIVLFDSIEGNSKYYIKQDANRVIYESYQFDGYVECLFDLGVISESEYDKFFDFTKQIRYDAYEIIYYI